jgi:ABC-type multidrug transport system ATPase subunit
MLTGMIAPTSGDALVYGSSIRTNMPAVRNILGVCPQHDILFGLLTVREHLELFAAIKDVPKEDTDRQIDDMIAQVGLTEKVNDKSAALSGGMQRKLSVGIALLGDSKIVFLSVFSTSIILHGCRVRLFFAPAGSLSVPCFSSFFCVCAKG